LSMERLKWHCGVMNNIRSVPPFFFAKEGQFLLCHVIMFLPYF